MLISLRGTSGSGKSYVVREILKHYDVEPFYEMGRKRPLGYHGSRGGERQLVVLGHYESPCGGCDTIASQDRIFELARKGHEEGFHVLFEGVLLYAEVNRTVKLHRDGLPLTVLAMRVPLELCLAGIRERRVARGDERVLNPKNTKAKHDRLPKTIAKLQANKVPCEWCDRPGTLLRTEQLLGL